MTIPFMFVVSSLKFASTEIALLGGLTTGGVPLTWKIEVMLTNVPSVAVRLYEKPGETNRSGKVATPFTVIALNVWLDVMPVAMAVVTNESVTVEASETTTFPLASSTLTAAIGNCEKGSMVNASLAG